MQSVCNECYRSSKTWIIPNKCSVRESNIVQPSRELVMLRERQRYRKNRTTSWKESVKWGIILIPWTVRWAQP